jgi:small subunit ribosomal protein S6
MPLYETVLIARNDVTQQQVEAIADEIGTELETDGGAVKKREYWGLRGLAYRIKKNRKGHYTLLNIDAPPAAVTEMERNMRISEDVLRLLTVRVDALEEAPSAMLRSRDERDRPRRGDRDDRDRDRPRRERGEGFVPAPEGERT